MTDADTRTPLSDPRVRVVAERFVAQIFGGDARDRREQEASSDGPFVTRQEDRGPLRLSPFPTAPRPLDEAAAELVDALRHDSNLRHPRYFGFIPGPAHDVSWLGETIAGAFNSHVGGWHLAPGASLVEQQVIAWANHAIGLDANPHAGGIIASGGSMAGLTALAAARDARVRPEQLPQAVAYLTPQTHSALKKALHVIGVAPEHIRIVPADADHRMVPAELVRAVAADRAAGLLPFVVVGTCGTTNTGAIDPLDEIADICAEHDLWFHCDGAYGASVVLSDRRDSARGIERADSVAWDGHKWLFQVYGCALLLVKDVRTLVRTYRAGGEYLQDIMDVGQDPDWWDLGPELTRPARAPRFWLTLQAVGTDGITAMVNRSIRNAEHFEQLARGSRRLEVVTPASLAIVTFTVRGDSPGECARRNVTLAAHLRQQGIAGIFSTELDERNVLRLCTISPAEGPEDFDLLMQQIDAAMDLLGL